MSSVVKCGVKIIKFKDIVDDVLLCVLVDGYIVGGYF